MVIHGRWGFWRVLTAVPTLIMGTQRKRKEVTEGFTLPRQPSFLKHSLFQVVTVYITVYLRVYITVYISPKGRKGRKAPQGTQAHETSDT